MDTQTEGQEKQMGDDTSRQTNQQSTQDTKAADGKELIDELTRLGQKFVEVVEVAWNSEQRKKIEEDLRTGLVSVASSLEDGVKRVSSSKEAKEAVNAAEDVAAKVRSSKIAAELSGALAEGLRAVSDQMDKLSSEMRQKAQTSRPGGTSSAQDNESQDIPIARDDTSQS